MVSSGVHRIAIVRIDDVTSSTTRRAIVARMIVGAEKVQRGIEQTCLLQSKKNRIGAIVCAKAARAQTFVRFAWLLFLVRQSYFQTPSSATFKHAQHVSRLRNLPTRQRIEKLEQTFRATLFERWLRHLNQTLRSARFAVAFAEARDPSTESRRCCRAPRPRALRRASSCCAPQFLIRAHGNRRAATGLARQREYRRD